VFAGALCEILALGDRLNGFVFLEEDDIDAALAEIDG
jgi:hypothetical protein